MITLNKIILLLSFNLLMVFANVTLKKIMNKYGKNLLATNDFRNFLNNIIFDINTYLIIFSLIIGLSIICYLLIEHNLSKILPITVSGNILLTIVISYFYLEESLSLLNLCGIILILIGILFVL